MLQSNEILAITPSDWKCALDAFAAKIGRTPRAPLAVADGVATINIHGLLIPSVPDSFKAFGFDATGYDELTAQVNEAADNPNVKRIVLHVDSGGGYVKGIDTPTAAIRAAREKKPVIAYISGIGASGAYWLASQATEIQASPVSEVGSIGVFSVMYDVHKQFANEGIETHVIRSGPHKGAGTMGDEITEEQLSARQETIDALAVQFVQAVAAGRNVPVETAQGWASGRAWIAGTARDLGLIDYVGPVAIDGTLTQGDDPMEVDNNAADVVAVEEVEAQADSETVVTELETEPTATENQEQQADNTEADPVAAERERCAAIMQTFAAYPDFAQSAISAGLSIEAARAAHYDVISSQVSAGADPVGFTPVDSLPSVSTWGDAVSMIAQRDNITLSAAGRKAAKEFPNLHKQAQGL